MNRYGELKTDILFAALLFAACLVVACAGAPASTTGTSAEVLASSPVPTVGPTKEPIVAISIEQTDGSYTVREYRIYRDILETPPTTTDDEAVAMISEKYGMPSDAVTEIMEKVLNIISDNGWFEGADAEIKRASDLKGEKYY